jgi:hypothetical protein
MMEVIKLALEPVKKKKPAKKKISALSVKKSKRK